MRLVIVSDTHNQMHRVEVPDGDVLIHCGDFTNRGMPDEVQAFNEALEVLPHPHKIVVAGNHDFLFESQLERAKQILAAATYLQDEVLEIEGVKFYGSPWQPEFHQWAFNVPRNSPRMESIWARIPDEVDVLVTHGPPFGVLDVTPSGVSAGCEVLLRRVEQVKPKVHCFGHIHQGYGQIRRGKTLFVNGANVNEMYRVTNPPICVDV